MPKNVYLLAAVLIVAAGCANTPPLIETDPRGQFWGFSRCNPLEVGYAYCESRNRPWGQL